MDNTIQEMEELLPRFKLAVSEKKSCQLMADEIEKPAVGSMDSGICDHPRPQRETIYYIEMKLEEAERANLVKNHEGPTWKIGDTRPGGKRYKAVKATVENRGAGQKHCCIECFVVLPPQG